MGVFHSEHETINASSVIELFSQLKRAYPTAKKLHIILDQARCHHSEELAAYARRTAFNYIFFRHTVQI